MVVETNQAVREAVDTDRRQLTNLLHFETYVHRHLDWRPPLDWIGYSPFLVLEKSGKIEAALACPPDPPGIAWIRTFAVSRYTASDFAWEAFWPQIQAFFSPMPEINLAAIPLHDWFRQLLSDQGFSHSHDVILLNWDAVGHTPPPPPAPVEIRRMAAEDLPPVQEVDVQAFDPLWHNSLDALQLAFRQAAIATVALDGSRIVGYQISTPSPAGAHLARLAVDPQFQGRGIGYALVLDLLEKSARSGCAGVSVNTQHNNPASLSVYEKAGFIRTGESYPIYQRRI